MSFCFTGSLKPPILLQQPPAANSSGSPACWAILDAAAYIADRKNGTYAETTTRTGQVLGVSFWLADPPAVSHLCVHYPGMSVTGFMDEPLLGQGRRRHPRRLRLRRPKFLLGARAPLAEAAHGRLQPRAAAAAAS